MGERDDYRFLDIKDAITSINQKVSLIGVIIECGFPKTTRGTDCFCTIKIVDGSYEKPGLPVNMFAEHFGMLPHVASFGDIIQLSNVMMKTHGGEVYAIFNKKSSTFAIYDRNDSEGFLPYQTYPIFIQRDVDKKLITRLRKWFIDLEFDEDSNNFSLMRELKEGKFADLACKVIHVQEFKGEWMGFLWDGTDAHPSSISSRLEDEKNNPLPLQPEQLHLSRDILSTFPTLGTVLRVVFDQGTKKHGLHLLHIGKWMKFINVYCDVNGGFWRGSFTPLTKFRYTHDKDRIVLERERLYNEREGLKFGRNPYWSFPLTFPITGVNYKDLPVVTLMDVLTYPEVTARFLCVVRVVAMYPWQAKDFSFNGVYRVRLTLEDATARIHAYLYGKDGTKLFGDQPTIDVLTRKRNALLGVATNDDGKEVEDGSARNPPWLQCCLKSYYLDKSDKWGSRHYRLYGTRLVVD
ncbi:protection of telomeres protein 1b-like [Cannabis sativa]|uniref:protection of telomeres protein 1b-like n=1 Tax=Cannabis sativa TaxID=3483 RepID=UPI0029CA55CA|nr:protection of telomeres protein 1b-like [Cannabis sativa]